MTHEPTKQKRFCHNYAKFGAIIRAGLKQKKLPYGLQKYVSPYIAKLMITLSLSKNSHMYQKYY